MFFDRKHLLHYLVIVSALFLGFVLTTLMPGSKLKLLSVIAVCIFYTIYGVLHHHLEHDLTIKIVVEYVIISVLVVSLFILVWGGM